MAQPSQLMGTAKRVCPDLEYVSYGIPLWEMIDDWDFAALQTSNLFFTVILRVGEDVLSVGTKQDNCVLLQVKYAEEPRSAMPEILPK